jgi:transcriptional regulator with XRE-family HTH domain
MSVARSSFQRRLARILRDLREDAGLSQEELADRARVHRTYIGLLERAEREPRLSNVARVLTALDVTWEELGRRLDTATTDRRR